MTQLPDSNSRAKSHLDALWGDGDDESEDDGPGAHNSTTIRPLSPTPIRVEIPARFQPLLLAIYKATPVSIPDADWEDVKKNLHDDGRYALLNYPKEEEYLMAAKNENMPVMYNTRRTGEINMVWTQLPYHWIQRTPTADDGRRVNDRNTTAQRRNDECKKSLKILHGSTNITTEIIKAILYHSKHHNHRIQIKFVANRLGDHMLIVVRHVIHLLRKRGLLIELDDRENVWVSKGLIDDKYQMLRETFKKHLFGRNSLKRGTELIEKDFWEEDPNVFLVFHTMDFAELVDHARRSTDCVKITAGDEVLWTE